MAAGSGAASGHGARTSTAALEASLDRRFQGVSNTMESIQGLSTWCIENKKHHSVIVRYWMKWLKKSDTNHRLNLFYLANDVIQNCKRKNAIAFRAAFAEVLPTAAYLIKDGKVRKSVERIFTIWEERSVYSEELIAQFKAGLTRKDREREREKERQKEKEKEKEKEKVKEKEKEKEVPPPSAPANPKAALKSKIVAEFTPSSFIDQLSAHKKAVEEEALREKQLEALRVDVCSSEALKRLKDKAGGNKFATDFEEGSLKLQEFVSFLEEELKTGPLLQDAVGNADIFYEMQYKEVKIVANAYNAFASRVSSLKRKLDALKSSLPEPEDSPIPSPSEDAPSPSGSDTSLVDPGASRAPLDSDLDGKAMDEGDLVQENAGQDDMDMSDEEEGGSSMSVDGKKEKASPTVSKATKVGVPPKLNLPDTTTKSPKTSPPASAPAPPTPLTTTAAPCQTTPTTPLGVNLANVDLGKISSILSSITSAMKNTTSPSSRPSPGTPTTPSGQSTASKSAPPSPALASILSRVDITPEGILNALSKTHTTGFSSLLQNVTNSSRTSPESTATSKTPVTPTTLKNRPSLGNSLKRDTPVRTRDWEKGRESSPPPPPPPPARPRPAAPPSVAVAAAPSLESKINSFLQGNPGFSLGLGDSSPPGGEWVEGTPVRDEAAGTPTQDEIMDTQDAPGGHNLSPTAYRSDPWDAVITPTSNSKSDDYLASSSRYGPGRKLPAKHKEEDGAGTRKPPSSSSLVEELKIKEDALSTQLKALRNSRPALERRPSSGAGPPGGKRDGKGRGREGASPGREGKDAHYHRIETLVSPCSEAAPALTGERIQTVESIRVFGRDSRHGGGPAGRQGPAMWYEEEEYMGAQPPSPHAGPPAPPPPPPPPTPPPPPPPRNMGQPGSEDRAPPMPLSHPPPHHLQQHLPPPPPHTHPHPHPHPHPHHPPRQAQFQMGYHGESMQPPSHPHAHPHQPPLSAFFGGPPPPIPRPPPPPIPQRPPPPHTFSGIPSAVMVGGVLVPVDRPLPPPPHMGRSDSASRAGAGLGPRGGKGGAPPPLMSSLLGEAPKMPPRGGGGGQVKEHFVPRHAPPLHRPGTPGAPPPLLGRVKAPEGRAPSHSRSPTPPSPSTPSPSSESAPPRPSAPGKGLALLKPPASPPPHHHHHHPHPRGQGPNARGPLPLLHLHGGRPPILPHPITQRPMLRGRAPAPNLHKDHPGGYRGGKRPGPPFAGPFHAPKRPFLPPRY